MTNILLKLRKRPVMSIYLIQICCFSSLNKNTVFQFQQLEIVLMELNYKQFFMKTGQCFTNNEEKTLPQIDTRT